MEQDAPTPGQGDPPQGVSPPNSLLSPEERVFATLAGDLRAMYRDIPNFLSRRRAGGSDERSAPRGSIPGPLRNSFDDIYEAILRGRDPNTNGTRTPNLSSFNAENSNNVPRGPNNPRGNQNPDLNPQGSNHTPLGSSNNYNIPFPPQGNRNNNNFIPPQGNNVPQVNNVQGNNNEVHQENLYIFVFSPPEGWRF